MLKVYETELRSRLLLGTSGYPSPAVLREAVKASRAEALALEASEYCACPRPQRFRLALRN